MRNGGSNPEVKIEKNNILAFFQGSVKHGKVLNLGIRLEDTMLVSELGAKMLTTYTREHLSVQQKTVDLQSTNSMLSNFEMR